MTEESQASQEIETWIHNAVALVGGQSELLRSLSWFCFGRGPKTLALYGPSGSGKSYLVEKLIETAPRSAPKFVLLSAARWYEQQSTTQLPALRRLFEPHFSTSEECVLVIDRFEAVTEVCYHLCKLISGSLKRPCCSSALANAGLSSPSRSCVGPLAQACGPT